MFPFKYKRETHTVCVETPKGKVCATSVNPKTNTMLTYGYCEEYGVKSPKRKSLKQKASGTKKKGTLKLRTHSKSDRPTWQDVGEWKPVGRSGEVGKEGEVFLVRREGGDQTVFALKQFKPKKSIAAVHKEARLQAQAAATGAAPRVVAVLETKPPVIVMERMDRTIMDVCKAQGNKLTAKQQWRILCAVERLEKSGVVHNDSNPLNLMIEGKGPDGQWRFVDFGMAKKASEGTGSQQSHHRAAILSERGQRRREQRRMPVPRHTARSPGAENLPALRGRTSARLRVPEIESFFSAHQAPTQAKE